VNIAFELSKHSACDLGLSSMPACVVAATSPGQRSSLITGAYKKRLRT
jgi:hypothetical protein